MPAFFKAAAEEEEEEGVVAPLAPVFALSLATTFFTGEAERAVAALLSELPPLLLFCEGISPLCAKRC